MRPGRAYGYRPTAAARRLRDREGRGRLVSRILAAYAAGTLPAIHRACHLNADGIDRTPWRAVEGLTILGYCAAGAGIVNNRLYIGEVVWNRSHLAEAPRDREAPAVPFCPRASGS